MKSPALTFVLLFHVYFLLAQTDTIYWTNGKIREIHEYKNVSEYNVKGYHPNEAFHYEGFVELWPTAGFWTKIHQSFDINGIQTVIDGNGKHFTYYENGNLKEEFNFNNSSRWKEYLEYYSSGIIKCKGNNGGTNDTYAGYQQGI